MRTTPGEQMPLERMTRRGVLAGLATFVGSGAVARLRPAMAAAADGSGSMPGMAMPTPGMKMRSGLGASVDPRVNGFDPTHILRDFDWGKTRRLASGRILREWEIVAYDKEIEVLPGVRIAAWTFNGRVPGPTLRCREGEALRIHFVNAGSHAHTLHFHGIHRDVMDGVAGIGRGLIDVGDDFVYEFDARPFGLHLYHCHAEPLAEHIQKGLYGAFIIDPKHGRAEADELVMVQNAYDSNFDGDNNIYAVNTVAFHFLNRPIRVQASSLVRIYLVNIVELDPINSFHVHGNFFHRFPTGTSLEPTEYTDTIIQGQAQRDILELRFPYEGKYMFHAHKTEFAELGWMGMFEVV